MSCYVLGTPSFEVASIEIGSPAIAISRTYVEVCELSVRLQNNVVEEQRQPSG